MRRDAYHDNVREALTKDRWDITDDPLDLSTDDVELLADLGAERIIAAERGTEKVCIEIKSFIGQSPVSEFHKALGQYQNYELSLSEKEPDRILFLAIPLDAWNDFFQRPFIQKSLNFYHVNCLIFDITNNTIVKWIKH
jgi:predicted ATP-binding protein involved in virulence